MDEVTVEKPPPTPAEISAAISRRESRDSGIGILCGIATFIVTWIYCIAEYGFLLGVGLGWLPSAIVAVIVGFILRYTWMFFAFIIGLAVVANVVLAIRG